MGRTFLIGLLVFLSAATVQAQSGYFTDPHGHITATFQGTDSGYSYWSDAYGLPLGTLYQAPSLLRASPAPLDLGVGGGFGQGLLQGLQQAHNFQLRMHSLALLEQQVADAQARAERSTRLLEQIRADRDRIPATPQALTPQARFEAAVWRFYESQGLPLEQAKSLIEASREGLLSRGRPPNVGCPDRRTLLAIAVEGGFTNFQHLPAGTEAWLMDHQFRWGSTRGEAAAAYMRSGYASDCP